MWVASPREVLALSARAFDRARAGRLGGLDIPHIAAFEDVLRTVSDGLTPRLDAAAWLAGSDSS